MGLHSFKGLFCVAYAVLCFVGASVSANERAEVPLGLWQTPPDALGIVFHVRTRPCGRALCARVERVKNRRGFDAPSNAVGQQVLWRMRPEPNGAFYGEYRDGSANQYLKSRVLVVGKELRLDACNDVGCTEIVWVRIR